MAVIRNRAEVPAERSATSDAHHFETFATLAFMSSDAGRGWDSDLETFRNTEARAIIERLSAFVRDASEAQVRAWKDAVPRCSARPAS